MRKRRLSDAERAERHRESARRYYASHREKARACTKKYYAAHREELLEYFRVYQVTHAAQISARRRRNYRDRKAGSR